MKVSIIESGLYSRDVMVPRTKSSHSLNPMVGIRKMPDGNWGVFIGFMFVISQDPTLVVLGHHTLYKIEGCGTDISQYPMKIRFELLDMLRDALAHARASVWADEPDSHLRANHLFCYHNRQELMAMLEDGIDFHHESKDNLIF